MGMDREFEKAFESSRAGSSVTVTTCVLIGVHSAGPADPSLKWSDSFKFQANSAIQAV